MTIARFATIAAATAMMASTLLIATEASASDRTRYRCKATGASDISMSAVYLIRSSTGRRKFSAEFEAAGNLGFISGARVNVEVQGVAVGSAVLEPVTGGDLVADLNFDTRPQIDSLPFPGNWPNGVGKGTEVKILSGTTTVLGCTMN